ncbi:MAG: four helix bundle protein [Acidobacteria bacterium]|nr:four helix bundle protein [Acidobacteriota bacterium]
MTTTSALPVRSYRDLLAWQKGMDLVAATYQLTKLLPSTEKYGLSSQMQRAAVSIPSNIAEGHGRRHRGDYVRSLSIANGSLKELETQMLLCIRLGFLQSKDVRSTWRLANETGRLLARLIQSLQSKGQA